jgi:protein-disulfide isomerase
MTRPIARRDLLIMAAAALAAAPAAAQTDEKPLEERGYALGEMTMGDPNAPVTIIEYASLTCGHCARFHTETLPEIKKTYIDTGKARLIFREVYFDQYGLWAGMVARCGGEGPYFGYVDTMLRRQREWAGASDIVGELQRIGRLGGLSAERLNACLSDEALMTRLVEDFQKTAGADEINATPTFIINGEKVSGAIGVQEMSALIDKHL